MGDLEGVRAVRIAAVSSQAQVLAVYLLLL